MRGFKIRASEVIDKAAIEAGMAEAEDSKEWFEKAVDVMEVASQVNVKNAPPFIKTYKYITK